jgi:ABC-2 type transport system permease protein
MKSYKSKSITQFIFVLIFLILVNFIGSFFYTRIDLTSEKRYTLSKVTENYLQELDDVVFFKIYLEGDELPPGLERLKQNIKEMLNEFKVLGGENIAFEFINPNESSDIKERNLLFQELVKRGLNPTNIQERSEEGNITQKTIFSGAIVYYKGNEIGIDFLKNNPTLNAEQNLNIAIQDIEFTLMSSIKKLSQHTPEKIAFITGHGELSKAETADLGKALKDFYAIERIEIDEKIYALTERHERDSSKWAVINKYKAIIIAGPENKFSEKDKFIIDQYIMNGGHVLWLLNGTTANMDSLSRMSFTMAMLKDLNLEDQLFTYGIRINADLVQDIQCSQIPLDVSQIGSKYPDFKLFNWPFFPLTSGNYNHPITRNLNLVKMEFASSIDTIGKKKSLKRTPLLFSSKHSKKLNAPVRVDLNIVNHKMSPNQFNKQYIPTAYLLEGQFNSVFANRLTNNMYDANEIRFREISKPAKMIIVSDASIIKNTVKRTERGYTPQPLEKDLYTGQIYGNKEFLLNAINYLCDESGILNMRNKEYKIRLLDQTKISGHKSYWQIINLVLPLLFVLLFYVVNLFIRRKKYRK